METVVRVLFVYVVIMALLRILGKREVSQLSPLELVMLILIPEIVSQALLREDYSMTNAVVAITTLMSLVYLTSALSYKFRRFADVVEGRPTLLVTRGRPVNQTMDLERISPGEIASEMRKVGIESVDQIKWAVLEPDGHISFIKYEPDDDQHHPREDPLL